MFEAVHLLAGTYAVVIVWWGGRNRFTKGGDGKGGEEEPVKRIKVLWLVPVVYGVVAGVEAVLAGSVVGLM